MAAYCASFSKLICEVDDVKALLISNGVKKDVNADEIFEKLERKATECDRVNQVVGEIIAELNSKEPDLIVLDEDPNNPEVELLVDLKNGYPDSKAVGNEAGKLASRAKEIFEQQRELKRIGNCGLDPFPETSKRTVRNASPNDELFDDSLPMEEVAVIEAVVAKMIEREVKSGEAIGLNKENPSRNIERSAKTAASNSGLVDTMLLGETAGSSKGVASTKVEGALPIEVMEFIEEHMDRDAEHSLKNEKLVNGFVKDCMLSEKNADLGEVIPLSAENVGPVGRANLNGDQRTKGINTDGTVYVPLDARELNDEIEIIPISGDETACSSSHGIGGDSKKMLAHFHYLAGILPHIEPSYLKQIVRLYAGDERRLNEFIGSALENDFVLPEIQPVGESRIKSEDELPSTSSKWSNEKHYSGKGATNIGEQRDIQVGIVGSSDSVNVAVGVNVTLAEAESSEKDNCGHNPEKQNVAMNVDGNEDDEVKADLYAEQLQYLVAVLPDADPTFLESLVKDFDGNPDQLKDFVANAMENRGGGRIYPTRGESQQKQEQEALTRRFTENFSVEDFLQVFPDPIAHFENEARVPELKYHELFMAYLRTRFRGLFINDLLSSLKKRNFNLSLTTEDLSNWKGSKRKTKRAFGECKWPKEQPISFLQEVAYIENKQKIVKYIKDKKEKRQKAYDEAKSKNELLTCGCCFEDDLLGEDMSTCSDGHLFCVPCIKKGAEVLIGDGKSTFPCMDGSCKAEFTLATLQAVLAPAVFEKLVQRLQAEEVNAAGIEGLETCPSCPYSTIPAPEDRVFKCLNPDCMKETCRLCREPSHIPLRCDEVERSNEVRIRTYIENKMTEALVRTCWKCNKKFIKESGCNKMSCSCGAFMCYICRQPVKDYSHFNPYQDRESNLCPLYSNDGQLDFEAVQAEAEKAKEEVMRQNPEVRLLHDPTLKLPKVPSSTSKMQAVPPYMQNYHHAARDQLFEVLRNMEDRLMDQPFMVGIHVPRNNGYRHHARVVEVPPIAFRPYPGNEVPRQHLRGQVRLPFHNVRNPHRLPRAPVLRRVRPPVQHEGHHVYPPPPARNPA